MYFANFTETY